MTFRNLWKVRKKLKRRVRLVFFGAEEIGLFDSYNYVAMHPEEMGDIRVMLNLDSGGAPGRRG